MKTFEIDGSRFSTLEGFFEEFSAQVIPGATWGKNLNALDDVLRGGFGTPEGGDEREGHRIQGHVFKRPPFCSANGAIDPAHESPS
jgi:hypothetical protein